MKTFDAEWRARFERFGQTYADEHEVSGWSPEGLSRRFDRFRQLFGDLPLPRSGRILELGCGAGTYVRYLAALGYAVVGVDYALPSLRRAAAGDPERAGRYVAADGYALPFVSGSFDLVVCIGVLQAVSSPERFLDEVARVLRPGGMLLVEALNPLEVAAMVRRLLETVVGRPPRVRCYSPFRVREWLERRALRPTGRVGIYLPPRGFPWLGRLLDRGGLVRLLERVPGGSLVAAHAFWWMGQKLP